MKDGGGPPEIGFQERAFFGLTVANGALRTRWTCDLPRPVAIAEFSHSQDPKQSLDIPSMFCL